MLSMMSHHMYGIPSEVPAVFPPKFPCTPKFLDSAAVGKEENAVKVLLSINKNIFLSKI